MIAPIAVTALFLCLSAFSSVCADDLEKELEIGFTDDYGYKFYNKINIDSNKSSQFNKNFTKWENGISEFCLDNKMDSSEILTFVEMTNSLIDEIKQLTYDPSKGIYCFPQPLLTNDSVLEFIKYHLLIEEESSTILLPLNHLHLRRIFAIGLGRAWLPFTHFDDFFIGFRFLPIFLQYSIGYAKSRWINVLPPSICVEDRLGTFNLASMGFVGLYINFGERYIGRPAGLVLVIGSQAWCNLGEDV